MSRCGLDLTPFPNFGEFLFDEGNTMNVVAGSNEDRMGMARAEGCKCATFD